MNDNMKLLLFCLSCVLIQIYLYSNALAIEITAVGDVYISQRIIEQHSDALREINLTGDIIFANFEGVLSDNHTRNDTLKLKLTMPPGSIAILKETGINTLSLANNHSLDLGPEQLGKTVSDLKDNGFHIAGPDDNGAVINVNDLTVRFIAFSFTGANSVNDIENAIKTIGSFKEDIIIVSAHMGGENSKGYHIPGKMEFFGSEKRGDVRKFAHACMDAGADLVLGHGPHILRGMELYRNKLIVYSLGNFIFDYPGAENHGSTPAFSISININPLGDFQQARITGYTLRYGIPVLDKGERACKLIQRLSSTDLNNNGLIFNNACAVYAKGGNP